MTEDDVTRLYDDVTRLYDDVILGTQCTLKRRIRDRGRFCAQRPCARGVHTRTVKNTAFIHAAKLCAVGGRAHIHTCMHAYIHKHTHTHTHTHTHKRRQARPEVETVRVPHYGHCVLIQNLPRARAHTHTHTHTHTHKGAGHELNSIAHNPCGLWYKVACGQIPTHIAGHVPRPNDRGKRAEQAHVRCAHTPKIVVVVTPGRLRPRVCVCAVGEAVGEVGRQGQSESGGRARRGTRTVTTARNRRTQRHREWRRAASTGGVGWGWGTTKESKWPAVQSPGAGGGVHPHR